MAKHQSACKIKFILDMKVFFPNNQKTMPIYSIWGTYGRISNITTINDHTVVDNVQWWQDVGFDRLRNNNFGQHFFLLHQFLLWMPISTMSSFFVCRLFDVCNSGSFSPERTRLSGLCKYMHPGRMGHMGRTNLSGTSISEGDTLDMTVAAISISMMVIVNTFVHVKESPPRIR